MLPDYVVCYAVSQTFDQTSFVCVTWRSNYRNINRINVPRQSSVCLSAHNNRERGGGEVNNKDRPIAFSIYCFVSVTNNYDSREVAKRRTCELRNQHVTRPRHTYRADTRLFVRYSPCMCIRGQGGKGGTLQELTVNSWSRDTRPVRSRVYQISGWTSRQRRTSRFDNRGNARSVFRTIRSFHSSFRV